LGFIKSHIQFAPYAFVPQCQSLISNLLSPLVVLQVSKHISATLEILVTSIGFKHLTMEVKHNLRTLYADS